MAEYRLHCLGCPELELDGKPLKLEMRKSLALLIYLRLEERAISREALAATFWPEFDPRHALANLRRALASLTKSLQHPLLAADREKIGLKNPGEIWLDAAKFQEAVAFTRSHSHAPGKLCPECKAALESALQLYRGDFLEGFNLGDCPGFDDWQTLQREWLRQGLAEALERAAAAHLEIPRHPLANAGMQIEANDPLQLSARLALGQPPQPLLKTKLYFPSLPRSRVLRPRLLSLLDGIGQNALTILSAPAGFGKTTALSEWVLQSKLPAGWFSLDEGDNDHARFLSYLIAAVESACPGSGEEAREMLGSSHSLPPEAALTVLIHSLEGVGEPFVLILDDYQWINAQAVHRAVLFLVEHPPPQMHLVIATRLDPPFGLARLRGRSQLLEIRSSGLVFTKPEAADFLNRVMALDLSAEEVEALAARTEGWIAGLQLAAIALQSSIALKGGADRSNFIRDFSGSNRYVLDYLVEEVLERLPTHLQHFMLRTSFLDRLCGALCDAVMRDPGGEASPLTPTGQQTLEELERRNLFIIPLDDERGWYRYHQLFADLLRARLEAKEPGRLPRLQSRACEWHEKHGMFEEAVRFAAAAGDHSRLARLIDRHALELGRSQQMAALLKWVKPLPEAVILGDPWFCILRAWELTGHSQIEAARPFLRRADELLQPREMTPEKREMLGTIAALRANEAGMNYDASQTIACARQALELLDPHNRYLRGSAAFCLGHTYYKEGDFSHARHFLGQMLDNELQAGLHMQVASILSLTAAMDKFDGRLNKAAETYRYGIGLLERSGYRKFFASGNLYQGLGDILRERNELEEAERLVQLGLEQNREWANLNAIAMGIGFLARIRLAQADLDGALALLDEGDRIERGATTTQDTQSVLKRARIACLLARGDLTEAQRVNREHQERWGGTSGVWPIFDLSMTGRLLILEGKLEQAVALLSGGAKQVEAGGHFGRLIEFWNLLALARQAQGRTAEALGYLRKSLQLTEPEGYRRVYLEEGEAMQRLLAEAGDRETRG